MSSSHSDPGKEDMTMTKINITRTLALGISLASTIFLPSSTGAQGMMDGRGMGMGMMGNAPARHMYVMRNGLDSKYAGMTNPLPASADNIKAGKMLFDQYCAACHGTSGRGDGDAGKSLTPPPADLTRLSRMRIASDGFVYWTIAEGGAAFNTAMPAMKEILKEPEIWKLVLYLRSL
jgi:mono/diheme cytochrome c family protein